MQSISPCPGGRCTSGASWPRPGVRYVVVVDGLSASGQSTGPPSVSAPPPAGLEQDLLEQDDLQVVPGVLGVQVFANGEYVPVTAGRGTPLPPATVWSYPGPADVAGWSPVFGALSGERSDHRRACGAGTVYAGYAPAGKLHPDRATAVPPRAGLPSAGPRSSRSRRARRRCISRSSRSSRSPSCSRCWPGWSCWSRSSGGPGGAGAAQDGRA